MGSGRSNVGWPKALHPTPTHRFWTINVITISLPALLRACVLTNDYSSLFFSGSAHLDPPMVGVRCRGQV